MVLDFQQVGSVVKGGLNYREIRKKETKQKQRGLELMK